MLPDPASAVSESLTRLLGMAVIVGMSSTAVALEPSVQPEVVEAEEMAVLERTGLTQRQQWPGLSGGAQLWWTGDARPGDRLSLSFHVARPGRYRITAHFLSAPDYGTAQISINGRPLEAPVDLYAADVRPLAREIGSFSLRGGENVVALTLLQPNPASRGSFYGIDKLELLPDGPPEIPRVTGRAFIRVYDPGVGENEPWYINDHTFIRDEHGTWHLFGITHAEPLNPLDEKSFAHATAPSLHGPWTKQPFALHADWDRWRESVLWAPHVIHHEGLYYMFYCAGDPDHAKYKLHLATSPDLKSWRRHEANPLVVDGFDARDPMVIRVGKEWVMYYTANSTPEGGDHVVAAVTSTDLLRWGNKRVVFNFGVSGTYGGPTESPFVVRRGDWYYLVCGSWKSYSDTRVFRSRDPFHWKRDDEVGVIPSHAAEIVRDQDGAWYVSHAGWEQGGVYLAPLDWDDGLDDEASSMPPPTTQPGMTK